MGSEEIEGLRRATSQLDVLLCLIEHEAPMSSQDIATELNITVNAVIFALLNLNKKGIVDRLSRGFYKFKLGPLLVPLLKAYLK